MVCFTLVGTNGTDKSGCGKFRTSNLPYTAQQSYALKLKLAISYGMLHNIIGDVEYDMFLTHDALEVKCSG